MAKDAAATIADTPSGLDWRVEVSEALHNSLRGIGNDRWARSAVPGREKLLAPAWFG